MPAIKAVRLRIHHLVLTALLIGALYWSWLTISGIMERRSIEALSTALSGRLIVIDPGHGGIDTGARSPGGTLEKDITLEVSKRLAAMLGQGGAAVILTRETDTWLADSDATHKKRSDLINRVDIANRNNADVFISIHANSFMFSRSQRGAQTFSQPGSEEGEVLSQYIQNELIRVLGNTRRKPGQIDYFIRRSKVPAVIVEIGFLSNPGEERLLLDSAYQSKIAFAIYCGLVKYFAGKDAGNQNPDPHAAKNGTTNHMNTLIQDFTILDSVFWILDSGRIRSSA
ncbi:MAG: N-acetylmuramoyl-L-alanine amidase [Peptococcaceae bacterium]|nr:N-acetylmuramoyl-L-alanine amidase [Peptococcaceae bacterium]